VVGDLPDEVGVAEDEAVAIRIGCGPIVSGDCSVCGRPVVPHGSSSLSAALLYREFITGQVNLCS
jgi:hypothetical protein